MASKIGLTLHEAMVAAMVGEKRYTMTNDELVGLIKSRQLYKQKAGTDPHSAQVFLRARKYPWLFRVTGNAHQATVVLRRIGDAD